jgi:hypothetical protein
MPGDYGNPGPSADSAMYSDEPDKPKEEEATEESPHDEEEEGTEYPPFTVPKSAFGGKDPKPGEQYYFDVDSVHEDEVVLKYAKDVKEEKGEEAAPEAPAPEGGGDSEMASMMS